MTHPTVDAALVETLARLAGLQLSSTERQDMVPLLEGILTMMDSLATVDVGALEPMLHPPMLLQPLRADIPGATLTQSQLETFAIDLRDGAFAVPKVLGS